jgi:hypothetical protein
MVASAVLWAFSTALVLAQAGAFQPAPALTLSTTAGHTASLGRRPPAARGLTRSLVMAAAITDRRLDRRRALFSASALLSGLAAGRMPGTAVAAEGPDLDVAEQVKAGVKKICTGGSQPIPPDALSIGVVDDGSPLMAAAKLGVAASGAKVVKLKGSVQEVQAAYEKGDCQALVVPSVAALKKVNSGPGLQCNGCSYGGGPAPPTWIIVMDSKGKTDTELQTESELTGRECSKESPGVCFQIGQAVAVYSYELLPKLKIETAADRPPCTGRFEGVC